MDAEHYDSTWTICVVEMKAENGWLPIWVGRMDDVFCLSRAAIAAARGEKT